MNALDYGPVRALANEEGIGAFVVVLHPQISVSRYRWMALVPFGICHAVEDNVGLKSEKSWTICDKSSRYLPSMYRTAGTCEMQSIKTAPLTNRVTLVVLHTCSRREFIKLAGVEAAFVMHGRRRSTAILLSAHYWSRIASVFSIRGS